MQFKINWNKIELIIVFTIVILNIVFKDDFLAVVTAPISLIIIMILCQSSVIAEKKSNINQLTPSPNGENCKGNGLNKNVECMCDECKYYLECFPDWRD